jgi:hypothetical protein
MADGVCWMQKRRVEDGHVCMAFSRKMEQEPMPAAPVPTPEPKPAALPVESLPVLAMEISDPPRSIRQRQPFSLRAFLKDLFGINRLGTLANNFPHPNGRGETNTNTNERNTP